MSVVQAVPEFETPILEMRGISKSFPGVKALDHVDVALYPGTVSALIGENGAGKSTLLKILSGAQPPDAGEIVFDGLPVAFKAPYEAEEHGFFRQNEALLEYVTAHRKARVGARV